MADQYTAEEYREILSVPMALAARAATRRVRDHERRRGREVNDRKRRARIQRECERTVMGEARAAGLISRLITPWLLSFLKPILYGVIMSLAQDMLQRIIDSLDKEAEGAND